MGVAYGALGRSDEAIGAFEAALALDPQLPGPHFSLGRIYRARRQWEEAIREYQAELAIDPQDADAYYWLGATHPVLDRSDEAIGALEAALALYLAEGNRLGEANMLLEMGKVLAHERHIAEALTRYEEAKGLYQMVSEASSTEWEKLAALRNKTDVLNQMGNVLYQQGKRLVFQGQNMEALAWFERALRVHHEVENRLVEANLLLDTGRVLASQDQCDEALRAV